MALPFPPEITAGHNPAEGEAAGLYGNYAWIARLADEMAAEELLDLKRVQQLVLHARKFRGAYSALSARGAGALDAIEGLFLLKGCRWARRQDMVADLAQLFDDCGAIADWIEANEARYKAGFSTNVVREDGAVTDEPVKVEKPAGVATRLVVLRGRFSAKG